MSGTNVAMQYDDALKLLESVLDRRVVMEPINALSLAMSGRPPQDIDLGKTAIGFDSNVFLRLATHPRSADILDYLPRHAAPLILPGQAIQEFWNNWLSVIQTVSSSVRKSFDQLAKEVKKVDTQFGDFEEKMVEMLDSFESQFGYMYDEKTKDSVAKMFDILQGYASCPFVPRERFNHLCHIRKQTRTPPGFKDEKDGDFFVWADFLLGLLTYSSATARGSFERVVLITNEKKSDWITRGTPHPILSAEVYALFEVSFDLWDLETFISYVKEVL